MQTVSLIVSALKRVQSLKNKCNSVGANEVAMPAWGKCLPYDGFAIDRIDCVFVVIK